jgi:hypothetical protein
MIYAHTHDDIARYQELLGQLNAYVGRNCWFSCAVLGHWFNTAVSAL